MHLAAAPKKHLFLDIIEKKQKRTGSGMHHFTTARVEKEKKKNQASLMGRWLETLKGKRWPGTRSTGGLQRLARL